MTLDEIISKVSEEVNLPKKTVELVYRMYWRYIVTTISSIDFDNLSQEEIDAMKTSFNIPSLGKFYTTGKRVEGIKKKTILNKLNKND